MIADDPPVSDTMARHRSIIIVLHWLTVGLILLGVAAILTRETIESREGRQWLLDFHRSMGLAVFAISVVRLALRHWLQAGKVNTGLPRILAFLSAATHAALYLLLIAIPLLGWAQSSASGRAVNLFWSISLPPLVGRDRDLAETLGEWHEMAAWALLTLVLAHAGAALWHHFFRRDHVLRSMLPLRILQSKMAANQSLSPPKTGSG